MIWFLVPPSRSIRSVPAVRSIFPYRLASECYAPFLSAHFPAMFRGGGSYRFLYRLVSLLVASSRWASRGYSLRFACRPVLLINSFGGPLSRLVRRSGSPSCSSFLGVSPYLVHRSRLVRSSRSLFSSSSPHSLVSSGGSWCRVVSLRLVLFCSRRISLVASHGHDGGGSSFSSRGGGFSSPLPPVVESDWADGGGGMNAPFSSARFFHQARAMAMMIWIRLQGRRTQ